MIGLDHVMIERVLMDIYAYYVAYKPITLLYTSFTFIEMKFYLSSFLFDICNKVNDHMQLLSEL